MTDQYRDYRGSELRDAYAALLRDAYVALLKDELAELVARVTELEAALKIIDDERTDILEARELVQWVVDWGRDPEECFNYSRADKERFGKEVGRV